MQESLARLSAVALRVRTPLGLAGIVMVTLYAIVSQILKLDIFDRVGAGGTSELIGGLLDKLFYLAMTSLLLGVAAYMLSIYFKWKPPNRKSRLDLVSAHLDTKEGGYIEDKAAEGRTVIRRRQAKHEDAIK
jgi:hypothetical protein